MYSELDSRLRVNRTANLTLSTSWQRVVFNGSSSLNVNTFGKDLNGNQEIRYDTTASNEKFLFSNQVDRNYNMLFTGAFGLSASIGITTTLQARFVIPNGLGVGVDLYFPFPESYGYIDLVPIGVATPMTFQFPQPIYASQIVRDNGMYLELRVSATLGIIICTLDECIFLITE